MGQAFVYRGHHIWVYCCTLGAPWMVKLMDMNCETNCETIGGSPLPRHPWTNIVGQILFVFWPDIQRQHAIGTASANSSKFGGIRPRMYIEDLL